MATPGIGSALRQERLRQGLSLDSIATQTRISPRFLEAIEAEDYACLPGVLFMRNFVRQFASSLGMDADSLLADLPKVDIDSVPLPDAAQFARKPRRDPRWAAALSYFLWIALSAGVAAGAYVYFVQKEAPGAPVQAMVSKVQAPPKPVEAPVVATVSAAPLPTPGETPLPAETSTVPAIEPAVAPDAANHAVQVVLKAREASWVQIIADGRNAFTGILHPNDSRAIAANALVKVTAGNAGGLEISLNGKSLDPLGPSGQVRTVSLTAEGPRVRKTAQMASAPL